VVIVDDNAGFRMVATALLEAGGLRVVGEAATGHAAVDQVLALRPDIVLVDVQLPDIDGFEVCERLWRQAAVVLCSVRAATDFGGRIAESGATGFISKARLSAAGLLVLVARR
jgi:two-component system, chemotaxis family, chemotaxis protein CheY